MFLFKESLRRNVGSLDAQMWLLTAGQDPPQLIKPYLDGNSLLVSELLPVVRSGLFVPSMPCRISLHHAPDRLSHHYHYLCLTNAPPTHELFFFFLKRLLKCLLLFPSSIFVLSLSSVSTSFSWLSQAASTHGPCDVACCGHTVVCKKSEGWEIRVGVQSPARRGWKGNATPQPVWP